MHVCGKIHEATVWADGGSNVCRMIVRNVNIPKTQDIIMLGALVHSFVNHFTSCQIVDAPHLNLDLSSLSSFHTE